MKKQKRILKTLVTLTMLITLLTPMISFATNETEETTVIFHTNTDTDVFSLGENVKVTVSLTGNLPVQAISFTLQYDKNKLEFVGATCEDSSNKEKTLEEDFYNVENPGTLILSMVSFDDLNILGINLNFKTIAIGEAKVQLTEVDCVADGNLVTPDVIDFATNNLATIKTVAFGDVDLSGTIDIGDITVLGQYLEGTKKLTEQQLENADVNLDGSIDDVDTLLIKKCISSIISLPIRYGDVTLDCCLDEHDIICLLKYLNNVDGIKLSERSKVNADTNLDGLLNEIDTFILRSTSNRS